MTWDKDYNDKKLSARLFQVAVIAIIVVITCFCGWIYGDEGRVLKSDINKWQIEGLQKEIESLKQRIKELEGSLADPEFYFQKSDEYTCLICGNSYKERVISVCCVNHSPGECCHYGEELVGDR